MISTGSTIEAAVGVLRSHCAGADVCVAAAAHGLLVGSARQRLAAAGITRLFVTDSLPIADDAALPVEVQSIAALVADAVGRVASRRGPRRPPRATRDVVIEDDRPWWRFASGETIAGVRRSS